MRLPPTATVHTGDRRAAGDSQGSFNTAQEKHVRQSGRRCGDVAVLDCARLSHRDPRRRRYDRKNEPARILPSVYDKKFCLEFEVYNPGVRRSFGDSPRPPEWQNIGKRLVKPRVDSGGVKARAKFAPAAFGLNVVGSAPGNLTEQHNEKDEHLDHHRSLSRLRS